MKNHFEIFGCGARIMMLFVFCSLGISNALAQEEREYLPFVEEGKVWYCSYSSFGPITTEHPEGEGIDCAFSMCGDTLVNGREYKKVYCQFGEYYGDKEQHYYCAVREENYQVFIIEEEEQKKNSSMTSAVRRSFLRSYTMIFLMSEPKAGIHMVSCLDRWNILFANSQTTVKWTIPTNLAIGLMG